MPRPSLCPGFLGPVLDLRPQRQGPGHRALRQPPRPGAGGGQRLGPHLRVFAGSFRRRRTPAASHSFAVISGRPWDANCSGGIPGNTTSSSPTAGFSGPSPTTGSCSCSKAARSWKTPCSSPPLRKGSARKTGKKCCGRAGHLGKNSACGRGRPDPVGRPAPLKPPSPEPFPPASGYFWPASRICKKFLIH